MSDPGHNCSVLAIVSFYESELCVGKDPKFFISAFVKLINTLFPD